jgi:hypothetical protein
MSFYARKGANFSPTSSLFDAYLFYGTGTDQKVSDGYTGVGNIPQTGLVATTTWQRFTFTGTVPATATEVAPYFSFTPTGTAGAADYLEITGVQLEVGSQASPYAPASATYQAELAMCQRYYWRSTAGSLFQSFGSGQATSTTQAYAHVVNPVTMRIAPTSVDFSTLAVLNAGGSQQAVSGLALSFAGSFSSMIQATVGVSLVAGNGALLVANNSTSAYIGFSAEL